MTVAGGGASKPVPSTGGASRVAQHSVTLSGTVNPEGVITSYWFQYGTGPGYGHLTSPQGAGAGTSSVAASATLAGLTAGTRYHYRIVASSAAGTAYGVDATFVTGARVMPRGVSLTVKPRHAMHSPFAFAFSGRLSGVAANQACAGRVLVLVTRGAKTLAKRRLALSGSCRFAARVRFPAGALHGRGRLRVTARFLGNGSLAPRSSRAISVRYG